MSNDFSSIIVADLKFAMKKLTTCFAVIHVLNRTLGSSNNRQLETSIELHYDLTGNLLALERNLDAYVDLFAI